MRANQPTHLGRLVWLLSSVLLLAATGCCSFEREWRQNQNFAYPERELAGCWEGTWQNDSSSRTGPLRAIITKEGDDYYRARFKATYGYVVPYQFETMLLVTDDGEVYTFEGDEQLRFPAKGRHVYAGYANSDAMQCEFTAENLSHGTFTLSKIEGCSQRCTAGACVPKPQSEPAPTAGFRLPFWDLANK